MPLTGTRLTLSSKVTPSSTESSTEFTYESNDTIANGTVATVYLRTTDKASEQWVDVTFDSANHANIDILSKNKVDGTSETATITLQPGSVGELVIHGANQIDNTLDNEFSGTTTFSEDVKVADTKGIILGDGSSNIKVYADNATGDLYFIDKNNTLKTLSQLAVAGSDEKTKVSIADTTDGFLDSKIVAGDGLVTSILNPAADEDLNIEIDIAATNDLLKITGGEVDTNLTSTKAELDKLSGFTGDSTGLNTVTDGASSNADSYHTHSINKKSAGFNQSEAKTAAGTYNFTIATGLSHIENFDFYLRIYAYDTASTAYASIVTSEIKGSPSSSYNIIYYTGTANNPLDSWEADLGAALTLWNSSLSIYTATKNTNNITINSITASGGNLIINYTTTGTFAEINAQTNIKATGSVIGIA